MKYYYTYILVSLSDDSFYFGQTNDLAKRFKRHNAGLEKYTRAKRPWKIFWSTEMKTRAEAMRLERKLKNMKSRKRVLEFITKANG
jgi:putative endonuclease